jgi:hypothetical protein
VRLAAVNYSAGTEYLEVVGRGRVEAHDAGFIAALDVIRDAGLTSLRDALRRHQHWMREGELEILLSDVDPRYLDPDASVVTETHLIWRAGDLLVGTYAFAREAPDLREVRALLERPLERERCELISLSSDAQQDFWMVYLELRVPTRGKNVGDAIDRADHLNALVQAALEGEPSADTTADLVRGGRAELLIGRYETDWLDVKSAPYRLDLASGRFELAKDVAMFANASGGIILIGAKTKRTPHGDRIRSVNRCRLSDVEPKEYRKSIDAQVYPRLRNATVELVMMGDAGEGVVLILVPEQTRTAKPFLVHGRVIDAGYHGLGFTWAVRDGEDAHAPRVETVHALLQAGQAVMAGPVAQV